MTKRRLGWSELRISKLVLGGNVFGWTADEATSFAILDPSIALRRLSVDAAPPAQAKSQSTTLSISSTPSQ